MSEDCHDSNNSLDHTCNAPGGDPDCGGCAYTRARAWCMREALAYPPKAVTLTDKDIQFLNDLKVTW
jgi:hypothetical protein